MNIEQKAKAYDKALEDIRAIYPNLKGDAKLAVEHAFPELAGSEDERIKKNILKKMRACQKQSNFFSNDEIAWLEKQKEQKPVEKQDYSGLNELERIIHRGFLCAGVENVPVSIIKETAQECLTQMQHTEWSEEEKDKVVRYLHDRDGGMLWSKATEITKDILDMLRPSWKPSEEQMRVFLKATPVNLMPEELSIYKSLCNDIQKLM